VKFVTLPPPGTLCQNQAVLELVARSGAKTFCEVGPGAGDVSESLCRLGMQGVGIEFSRSAASSARATLESEIKSGRYRLVEGDFTTMAAPASDVDLALSVMVMEHIKDDADFLTRMVGLVRPGGTVIVGVPGRKDRWGIEDESAGHYRRYERAELESSLAHAGLEHVEVRSVSVPIANLTFHLSNFLIRRAGEDRKLRLSMRDRTETSGIRDIPFKTVFPAPFKLLLNPVAMSPLFLLQRLFYRTGLGLTLLGTGTRPQPNR
jgi:SAM-dependent methyltransferase